MIRFIRLLLGYGIVGLDAIIPVVTVRRVDQQLIDKHAPNLILYEFYLCPFCVRVRRMLRRLNMTIDIRDANRVPAFNDELLRGGGRVQVPCLRIEREGTVTWMYESKAINQYLLSQFSK